jgi:hypothetical protein
MKIPKELEIPSAGKFQRYDMKRLLSDPKYKDIRRSLMVRCLLTTQAREGIDISWDVAYNVYDEFQRQKSLG